jgi:hypothetical protein
VVYGELRGEVRERPHPRRLRHDRLHREDARIRELLLQLAYPPDLALDLAQGDTVISTENDSNGSKISV